MSTESSTPPPATPEAMKPLPWKSVIGYGAGDAANNVAFTTTTMFLLVYYTDVLGISAIAAGTLLFVVRILDAFFDVFAGVVVDRSKVTRWGKFRPFLAIGAIPLLVLAFLNFHIPQIGESGTLLLAYLAYALIGLAYSFVNIPFGSLAGAMTQQGGDRAKLASARVVGATLISAGLGAFVSPLLVPGPGLQAVFTRVMLVLVLVGFVFYVICFLATKERVVRDVGSVPLRQSLRAVGKNKPLLMLMASSVFFLSAFLCLNTVQIYYIRDVLQAPGLFPLVALGQLIMTFVLVALMPKLVVTFGKKTLYMVFGLVVVLGGVIISVNPGGSPVVGLVGLLVALLGVLANNVVVFALEADTVEYSEWKTGVRSEGSIYAVFSFTRKLGQSLGGALGAWAIGIGGYVSGAAQQTPEAIYGIQVASGFIPAALALIAVVIMIRYPLTEKVHTGLMEQIQIRRQTGSLPLVDPMEEAKGSRRRR